MATLCVLSFDAEGRPIQFDVWLDDLQLYLQRNSRDGISLFDLTSGASLAPPNTADSATRSQWLTRDACLAVRNHLPLAERTHFGQHRTARAVYDVVVARYSSCCHCCSRSPCSALPVPRAVHLCHTKNPPPMYITLYYIVTRLPNSLSAVKDHLLALDPTDLTLDLLEKHLLAAETSIVAVGASLGTPRTPFFEGCSPSPLVPSVASATAIDFLHAEEVRAASAPSGRHRSGRGKGGQGGGGGSGGGGDGGGGSGGGSGGVGGCSGGGSGGGSESGGCSSGGGSGSGGRSSSGNRGGAVQRGRSGGGQRRQ
ncbi:unnamed protein product [Closterium sp. NIES-53]